MASSDDYQKEKKRFFVCGKKQKTRYSIFAFSRTPIS
jgi:hypothetical protein